MKIPVMASRSSGLITQPRKWHPGRACSRAVRTTVPTYLPFGTRSPIKQTPRSFGAISRIKERNSGAPLLTPILSADLYTSIVGKDLIRLGREHVCIGNSGITKSHLLYARG